MGAGCLSPLFRRLSYPENAVRKGKLLFFPSVRFCRAGSAVLCCAGHVSARAGEAPDRQSAAPRQIPPYRFAALHPCDRPSLRAVRASAAGLHYEPEHGSVSAFLLLGSKSACRDFQGVSYMFYGPQVQLRGG